MRRTYTTGIILLFIVFISGIAGSTSAGALKSLRSTFTPSPEDTHALKIEVKENGLYRITYDDIIQTGIDAAAIDPGTLKLSDPGGEVAFDLNVIGDTLVEGDFIEFYGTARDDEFTGTNVYRLEWGGTPGKIISAADGTPSGSGVAVNTFAEVLHLEENHEMWTATPDAPASDYWFREKLTAPVQRTYSLIIPSVAEEQTGARIRISFQGRSSASANPDHHVRIALNGTPLSDDTWDGMAVWTKETVIPAGTITSGTNTLSIELPGDTGSDADAVYFNWCEVEYRRLMEADGNEITFTTGAATGTSEIHAPGFESTDIRILDITNPRSPIEITGFTVNDTGGTFEAVLESDGTPKTYYAFGGNQIGSPSGVSLWKSAGLKSASHGADYILITAEEFLPSVELLLELREVQGLRVIAVTTEEIMNEFAGGIFTPVALGDFLTWAYKNWQAPSARYVFLVGDSNLDYRDYFGTGKKNIVPVHLSVTADLGLTPCDNWYACVDGDDVLPDFAIGRMPGADASAVAATIEKIVMHDTTPGPDMKEILLVTDDDDTAFDELSDELTGYVTADYSLQKIYSREYETVEAARNDIISGINGGPLLTNYVGHGDLTRWGGGPTFTEDFLFETFYMSSLTNNDSLPFVIALNCLNGYFAQSLTYSLGEEFIRYDKGGAIAFFAPSGLAYLWEHSILNRAVFSSIFEDGMDIIGDIATESKKKAYAEGVSNDLIEMFNLFGDPASRFKADATYTPVDMYSITASAGSHGSISLSGNVKVIKGYDRTFTITPEESFSIVDVTVDGKSVGAVATYTFTGVTANHTINASFSGSEPAGGNGDNGGGGCFISTMNHIE